MSDNDSKVLIDKKQFLDPSLPSYDNLESSFFQTQSAGAPTAQLPSPEEVLQRNAGDGYGVLKYEELNLVVKYGGHSELRIAGAVAMHAVRQTFSNDDVPVPELFRWKTYNGQYFIYMELIPGTTLQQAWSNLREVEKASISARLKQIVAHLRSAQQSDGQIVIDGGPVQDDFFRDTNYEGPRDTVFDFNKAVISAALPNSPLAKIKYRNPYREFLRDDYQVCLTHADLNLAKIMVQGSKGARSISGIIDWDQAGWYPEYWEHCKMARGIHPGHEWWTKAYLEFVTGAFPNERRAIAEYMSWRGAF